MHVLRLIARNITDPLKAPVVPKFRWLVSADHVPRTQILRGVWLLARLGF
jgi:hypothetical protein